MATTNDIARRVTAAILEDPFYARKFIERTIEDALPLIVRGEWDSEHGPDFAIEVIDRIRSHYEPTESDVEVISAEYMLSYDEIDDNLKRDEDDPLDVWMRLDASEDVEYEANTYRRHDGDYVIEWYHVDVGEVTAETFGTYGEAKQWYADNEYQQY